MSLDNSLICSVRVFADREILLNKFLFSGQRWSASYNKKNLHYNTLFDIGCGPDGEAAGATNGLRAGSLRPLVQRLSSHILTMYTFSQPHCHDPLRLPWSESAPEEAGLWHTDTGRHQNCARMQKHSDMYAYANLQGQANTRANMQSAHAHSPAPLYEAAILMQLEWDQKMFTLLCMCGFHLLICENILRSPLLLPLQLRCPSEDSKTLKNTLSECLVRGRH